MELVFTAWRTGREIRGNEWLGDKEEWRDQNVEKIKTKKENNWYDCNNAKGKNNIGLRMDRKTKNEFIRILKVKINFIWTMPKRDDIWLGILALRIDLSVS